MISEKPNNPMATTAMLTPSARPDAPNVKRETLELMSVPTRPMMSPRLMAAIALSILPCASTADAIKPINISEKYSGASNLRAIRETVGPARAMIIVQTVPAKNDARAAIARAGPARPCFAIS